MKKVLILLFILTLVGCSSTGKTISTGSVVDNLQEQEKIQKEINILTGKEKFDLDYADGAYLEDYTEVRKRLNKEAQVYYKEFFKDKLPEDFYFRVDLDLFYSLLRKARDESLSYETILNDYSDQIDEIYFTGFSFYPTNDESFDFRMEAATLKYLIEYGDENSNVQFPKHKAIVYQFKDRFYDKFIEMTDEEMSSRDLVHRLYNNVDTKESYAVATDFSAIEVNTNSFHSISNYFSRLKDNYSNEYLLVNGTDGKFYFSPMGNKEIVFETNTIEDAYYSTLAADYLTKEIYKILDELDASDKMGVFVATPTDSKHLDEEVKTNKFEDFKKHSDIHTTLYYHVSDEKDIDYVLLSRVHRNIEHLVTDVKDTRSFYIIPFVMEETKGQTFLKLLRDNPLTENYIRDSGFGGDWVITNNNSEMFKYFDIYGERLDFIFKTSGRININISPERYYEDIKYKNEYGR